MFFRFAVVCGKLRRFCGRFAAVLRVKPVVDFWVFGLKLRIHHNDLGFAQNDHNDLGFHHNDHNDLGSGS